MVKWLANSVILDEQWFSIPFLCWLIWNSFSPCGDIAEGWCVLGPALKNIGETYSIHLLYPNEFLVPNLLSSLPIWITQHSNCLVYWTFLVRENEIVEWILPGCHCGHHVVKGATAPFSGWFQSCFSQMVRKQQKDASFPAIYLLFFSKDNATINSTLINWPSYFH